MPDEPLDGPHLLRCRWCEFTVPAQSRGPRGGVINGMEVLTRHTRDQHREKAEQVGAAATEDGGRLKSAVRLAEDARRRRLSFLPRTDHDAGPRS